MNTQLELSNPAEAMEVVAYELGSWHLLSEGEELYLDVRTGLLGRSFWLLMKLNAEERAGYHSGGAKNVEVLVQQVLQRPHFYFLRNEPIAKQRVVFASIDRWRQSPGRPRVGS